MARTPLNHLFLRALRAAIKDNPKCPQNRPLSDEQRQGNWTRRRFLAGSAVVAAASTLSGKMAMAAQAIDQTALKSGNYSVAIVGGGIAGLNAAYQLKKAGISATIYEASPRVGGRILSRTGAVGEGLTSEIGAEFINTDHADMLSLVQDFNLSLFDKPAYLANAPYPISGYFFEGKNWTEAEIADLLRLLAEQLSNDAALLDADWDTYAPQFDQLSVTDYLNMHAGLISAPVIRTLIENTIRTEYGAEPQDSTALQLLFNLTSVDGQQVELLGYSDEAYVVQGGNSKIIDGLQQALAGQIYTRMPLTKVKHFCGKGLQLTFNNDKEVECDYAIITVPFTALRDVELEVGLPRKLRRFIEECGLGKNEKLIAGFSDKSWRRQNGFMGETWTDLGASEAWDSTLAQTDHTDGALTFYMGGEEVDQFLEDKTAALQAKGEAFIAGLDGYLPGTQQSATGKFVGTQWTNHPWIKGAYANFRPGQLTRFADWFWIENWRTRL